MGLVSSIIGLVLSIVSLLAIISCIFSLVWFTKLMNDNKDSMVEDVQNYFFIPARILKISLSVTAVLAVVVLVYICWIRSI